MSLSTLREDLHCEQREILESPLPPALAMLTMEELILRLQPVLEADDFGAGMVLVHEFFRLVAVWERKHPNTPSAAYQAALLAAENGEMLSLGRIATSPLDLEQGIGAVILATTWGQVIDRHLPPANRALATSVSRLLRDVLDEPQHLLAH